jgi:hypothetical protein
MALILNLWSSDDDNPSERWDSSWLSVVVVLAIGMHVTVHAPGFAAVHPVSLPISLDKPRVIV